MAVAGAVPAWARITAGYGIFEHSAVVDSFSALRCTPPPKSPHEPSTFTSHSPNMQAQATRGEQAQVLHS